MTKLVILVCGVALIQIASALECYHCEKEACNADVKTLQKAKCGAIVGDDKKENACLKLTYKDKADQKEWVSKKCVQVDKTGDYKCPNTMGEPVSCPVCKTELCNSSAHLQMSFAAFFGLLLAYLVPKCLF